MTKWTIIDGNWRQVWRAVEYRNGKLVEVAGATATVQQGRAAA